MKIFYNFPRKPMVFYAILAFLIFAASSRTIGATYYSKASGNWGSSSTWGTACGSGTGAVPGSGDNVIICNTYTVTIAASTAQCLNLTINSGGILKIGAFTLTISGDVSISGTWNETGVATVNCAGSWTNNATTFTISTGTHTFSGTGKTFSGATTTAIGTMAITGTYTNSGTITCNTALSGAGTLTNNSILNLGGACSITTFSNGATGTTSVTGAGNITTVLANFVNSGILNLGGSGTITGITNNLTVNLNSSGTIAAFTNNATGTLNISTTPTVPTFTALTATAGGNTVNYNGLGAQTVKAVAYGNLTLSGSGAKTMTGVVTIGGDLTITGSATMTGNAAFTVTGGLNYTSSGSTTLTAATGISLGDFNQNAGTLIDNGNTITMTGTGALTWSQTAGTFTATGTVNFTGAAPEITGLTLSPFNNLQINGVGTAKFMNALTISATLTLGGSSTINPGNGLTHNANSFTINSAGQNAGTYGSTASAATYKNDSYFTASTTGIVSIASSSCIPGTWLGIVSTDWNTAANWCGGIPTLATNVTIPSGGKQPIIGSAGGLCNNITINSGATLTITSTYSLTVAGTWTNNGGTLTANSSTVTFTGSGVTIGGSGSTTFNNVSLTGTASVTTAAIITIGGNLSIGNGTTFTAAGYDITVTGTTTVGGGASGSLINSSATGAKLFTGLVTVANGATWNNSANEAIEFRGGITNNGTFTAGTAIQSFTTNAQALTGTLSIASVTVTGVTLTNSGNLTVGTALTGTGTLTNNSTMSLGATCSITTFANAGTLTVTGTNGSTTVLANFTNTGTVNFQGTGGTFAGLTNNAGGIATITGAQTITSFNNATATSTLNVNIAANPIGTLTSTVAGNTVNYGLAGIQTVKAVVYSNLTLSGSGAKTMTGVVTIGGDLTITGSATMTSNAAFTVTGGLNYTSSGATTLTAATAISLGDFNQNAGTLTDNGNTITMTGTGALTWSQTAGTFTATGTVIFNGASPEITASSHFNNLTINSNPAKFMNALTVNAGLSLGATGTINPGNGLTHNTNTFTINGAGQNSGTYGSTSSAASIKNDSYFTAATTGIVNVITPLCAAGTWLGAIGNDWNTAGNWCGGIPTLATNVTIPSGGNQPLIGAAGGLCKNITINSGASLAISSTNSLTVAGTWTNNGGSFIANSSTVTFTGTGVTIGGSASTTFYNVSTSGTATVSTGIATTIGNNLSIGNGTTFTAAGFNITVTGTTTVGGGTSGSLIISSATGTKLFTGLVTVANGGIWNNSSSNEALEFRGGITNNGTFNAGTGIQSFTTNAQALNGTLSIPSVTVTGVTLTNSGSLTVGTALAGAGGTLTNNGTLNLGGTCSITNFNNGTTGTASVSGAGNITTVLGNFVNGGILNLGGSGTIAGITNNLTVNLNSSGTITAFTNNGAGTFNIFTTPTVPTITTLTATAVGNTVNYSGAGAQTVKNVSYYHLTLSGSGVKTMTGVTTIGGDLTISGTATMTGNAALAITGTLNYGSSGATTLTAAINISTGKFNQTAGTFIDNSDMITVTGTGASTWVKSGGTFTATGTVTFTGASPQISACNFNNLTIAGSNPAIFNGVETIAGCLTINTSSVVSTGAFTSSAHYLFLGGTSQAVGFWGHSGSACATMTNDTYFATASGCVNVTAISTSVNWQGNTTQWNLATNWMPNVIPGAGTDVILPAAPVGGNQPTIGYSGALCRDITIANGATLTMGGAYTLTVSGNWINNGTTASFVYNASTVNFTGTGKTIGGTGATTFYNLSFSGTANVSTSTNVDVNGSLDIGTGATFTETGAITADIAGDLINDGTYNASTGVHTLSGAATPAIGGFSSITIPSLTITGSTHVNSGTLYVTTALVATKTLSNSGTLYITGTSSGTLDASSGGGNTVNYNGVAQTVMSTNYINLILSGSGVKTLQAGTATISGDLTLTSASSLSATTVHALAISHYFNIGVNTTFTAAGFVLTVGWATTINGTLAISSGTGLKTFSGNVSINTGGIFNTGGFALTFGASFQNSGTFNDGASVITIDGTSTGQVMNGFTTTGGIIVSKTSGIVTFKNTTTAPYITFNTATGNPQLLVFAGGVINLSGALTINCDAGTSRVATLSGDGTINCASVSIGSAVTPSSNKTTTLISVIKNLNVTGNVTLTAYYNSSTKKNNPEFDPNSGTVLVGGTLTTSMPNAANTAKVIMGASNPTLILNGSPPVTLSGTGTSTLTFNTYGATVKYNRAGAQTLPSTLAYFNLSLDGGIKTMPGILNITGDLDIGTAKSGTQAALVAGTTSTAQTLSFGGIGQAPGSWGSPSSSATFKTGTYFTGTTGIINANCRIYTLISTTAATPVCASTSATATINANLAVLPNGVYTFTYDLSGANVASALTASVTMTGGIGYLQTAILANPGTTTLTIDNITQGSCSSNILANNTFDIVVSNIPNIVTVTASGSYCNSTTLTASGGAGGTIYYQGTTPNGTSTATPSTSHLVNTSGTYYFRAQDASGCWGPQGSATVIINTTTPACVSGLVPLNGSVVSIAGTTLAWNAVAGADGYKVYFDYDGTNPPVTVQYDGTNRTWDTGPIGAFADDFWQIVPYNGCGSAASCTVSDVVTQICGDMPGTQASNVTLTNVCATSLTATWIRGSGTACAVFIKQANSGIAPPIDGTNYVANTVFGSGTQIGVSGWYCIYNGAGTTVNVTGLTLNKSYIVEVCEYATAMTRCFDVDVTSNNPVSTYTFDCTVAPGNIAETPITTCGSTVLIIPSFSGAGSVNFNNCYLGGTPGKDFLYSFIAPYTGTYSIQCQAVSTYGYCVDYFWSTTCTNNQADWNCIGDICEAGTYGSMNWTAGTTYYILLASTSSSGTATTHTFYINCPAGLTPPAGQTTNLVFGNGCQPFSISWTRPASGAGSYVAVFMKAAGTGTALPVDGTWYHPSIYFGLGDQIGNSGWYCIYNGTGTHQLVSNLTAGATYIVQAFEYNGTGSSIVFNSATDVNNPLSFVFSNSGCYLFPTVGQEGSSCGVCTQMISGTGIHFYDDGGAAGNYSADIQSHGTYVTGSPIYRSFCPSIPGQCVTAFVNSVTLAGGDAFSVYLGASPANSFTNYTVTAGSTYTSNEGSGCISFRFKSATASPTAAGWDITLSTASCAEWTPPLNSDCSTAIALCSFDALFQGVSNGPGFESSCGNSCLLQEYYTSWYSFSIYHDGQLGLQITSLDNAADYDFAIFKANNCGQIENPMRCSFADNSSGGSPITYQSQYWGQGGFGSGPFGITGMMPDADNYEGVAGDGHEHGWVDTIGVHVGETYYLMVDQYTKSDAGCNISFVPYNGAEIMCPVVDLPVAMVSFTGKCVNDTVKLRWVTASETNNDYFIVERSKDGNEWQAVNIVDGAGNSNSVKYYDAIDGKPFKDFSYYRLKQVDFNGASVYSKVVVVNCTGYGVPMTMTLAYTDDNVTLFLANGKSDYTLTIFDCSGQLVYSNIIENSAEETQKFVLSRDLFSTGLYVVHLQSKEESVVQKFFSR